MIALEGRGPQFAHGTNESVKVIYLTLHALQFLGHLLTELLRANEPATLEGALQTSPLAPPETLIP